MPTRVIAFFGFLVAACLLVGAHPAFPAESRNLPKIGIAVPVDPVTDVPYNTAYREGLQEQGYVDGENVLLIVRYANGDPKKYPAIIQELIALDVDILVGEAEALRNATTTIPIVSATMDDPVMTGLVTSLAHPGGNITGVSAQAFDIWPKHLELARELVPNLKHLCVLLHRDQYLAGPPDGHSYEADFESLARGIGVDVSAFAVASFDDIQAALGKIHKQCSEALIIRSSPLMLEHGGTIMEAVVHRLPVIGDGKFSAEAGPLLSYSMDYVDAFRRSTVYMVKILNGAKPGDLPIEQPTRFKLVVNMKVARELKLTIPESIMVRADQLIQ
jgi:putative ABC transport system substrate-binding protein